VLSSACRSSLLPETSVDECHSFHFITEDAPVHLVISLNSQSLTSNQHSKDDDESEGREHRSSYSNRKQPQATWMDNERRGKLVHNYTILFRSNWFAPWNNLYAIFFRTSRASCALTKSDRTFLPLIWTKGTSTPDFIVSFQDVSKYSDMTL
jgi:hypothetical protein